MGTQRLGPLHEVENARYSKFKDSNIYGSFLGATPIVTICKLEKVPRVSACPFKPVSFPYSINVERFLTYVNVETFPGEQFVTQLSTRIVICMSWIE
ncbi:hypothetical protein NPIL_511401 [Nephila pilipes]|uniref:Uncharacterized protein n=2 Tax=Nephila pilipes TaxID=299642 RepID=A0A8X6J6P6_NEPPI|nr:hypothetical protein NPIL_553071 [Nephila pilipes]GFT37903.1 hypothetical protein NPIL_364681 [Nephila pilipes]GFT73980.1 hypothetical protein NPIL_511401 [Nephila pilipes]